MSFVLTLISMLNMQDKLAVLISSFQYCDGRNFLDGYVCAESVDVN